ncbi:hypothetical protein NQ318_007567, partial [Aromia moschata]
TKIQLDDNMSNADRVVLCVAEIAGTAILVFLGCMGCATGVVNAVIPPEQAVTPATLLKPRFNETVGLCSPNFNSNITPVQAMLVEFILSLILVWVCCALWDSRNVGKDDSLAIRLGLTVAGLIMAGGSYTGANLNPARSFGPALINGDWDNHWVKY